MFWCSNPSWRKGNKARFPIAYSPDDRCSLFRRFSFVERAAPPSASCLKKPDHWSVIGLVLTVSFDLARELYKIKTIAPVLLRQRGSYCPLMSGPCSVNNLKVEAQTLDRSGFNQYPLIPAKSALLSLLLILWTQDQVYDCCPKEKTYGRMVFFHMEQGSRAEDFPSLKVFNDYTLHGHQSERWKVKLRMERTWERYVS